VSDQLLTFFKYIFLALLYLFFLRVLRAVWTELREPKPAPRPVATPALASSGPATAAPLTASGAPTGTNLEAGRLVVVEPRDRRGTAFDLRDELTVGRAAGCGVGLADDTFVSHLHARVFRRDGDLYVEDLGSTNGTFLNDQKVMVAVPIRPGDRLQVGKTTMELQP